MSNTAGWAAERRAARTRQVALHAGTGCIDEQSRRSIFRPALHRRKTQASCCRRLEQRQPNFRRAPCCALRMRISETPKSESEQRGPRDPAGSPERPAPVQVFVSKIFARLALKPAASVLRLRYDRLEKQEIRRARHLRCLACRSASAKAASLCGTVTLTPRNPAARNPLTTVAKSSVLPAAEHRPRRSHIR